MSSPMRIPIDTPQRFFDDREIDERVNVTRVWHPLRKHPANPLLVPEGREEVILLFGTVLRDAASGLFRMWYTAIGPNDVGESSYWIAYAESDDGIDWRRPDLGVHPDIAPNAVFAPATHRLIGFAGVVEDSDAPSDERFKLMASAHECATNDKEYVLAISPDGFDWNVIGTFRPDAPAYPDTCCLTRDPTDESYILFTRAKYAPAAVYQRKAPNFFGRAVARCTSVDFRTWSKPEFVVHVTDDDPFGSEIYSLMAYPLGGEWIGLHQVHTSLPEVGLVDIAVSHSPDGRVWTREPVTVLPNGGIGEWDRFSQSTATAAVNVGDETRIYYSGRTYRHGEYRRAGLPDTGPMSAAIGVATIRRDGWCSLNASFDSGTVTTKPLVLADTAITLNAACRFGSVQVEAIEPDGDTVIAQSRSARDDGVSLPLNWESPPPVETPIRLKFRLTNARLYAWTSGCENV